jgi:hypothetical protein
MTRRKTYKHPKKGSVQHVRLEHWFLDSDAWRSLSPAPRALYIELKKLYNGHNNGEFFLSHREGARLLNVHRNSIGGYFQELIERGFIKQTKMPHLGPSGIGRSSKWALTEAKINEKPATKEFMRWRKK